MKCIKSITVTLLLGLAIVLTVLLKAAAVQADSSDSINATVKISICGNEIIEGGEDCEGKNLNGETCESLGFGPGDLSCDIACSFDTYGCSPAPTPTPTQTPTPTLTPTPTPISTSNPTSVPTSVSSSPTSASAISLSVMPTFTVQSLISPKPTLPPILKFYDLGNVGKIRLIDLPVVAKIWVDEWKKYLNEELKQTKEEGATRNGVAKCDINNDNRCDIRDFSILLFYVSQ